MYVCLAERLNDEEANEMIEECSPEWVQKVDDETVFIGRIYFENYRTMLLDAGAR
jgi:hypothetical protein